MSGFAYPVPIGAQSRGMTLRDQAALAALQSLGTWMPAGYVNLNTESAMAARAEWCFNQADAWLAARDEEPTP